MFIRATTALTCLAMATPVMAQEVNVYSYRQLNFWHR